jgi:proline iminopeptidase
MRSWRKVAMAILEFAHMANRRMAASVLSYALAAAAPFSAGCSMAPPASNPASRANQTPSLAEYFDTTGRDDVLSGGVKVIPITTPKGTFKVWTKRVGNNPKIKVLLLHGGPGVTHEVYEVFDSHFPRAGIEYYYYDQLGSFFSDQPDEPSLWDLPRFVEEVEQVRQALHLDKENFYLFGQSWGGLLGIEYALKYQQHLKGLIVSNMVSSMPFYNEYAHKVLMPAMDQKALVEILATREGEEVRRSALHGAADSQLLHSARPTDATGPVA